MYSSVIGYLGCFWSLAVVNSAEMNIGVQVLYCILTYALLGRCPGAISLYHMAVLSLAFWVEDIRR
jgi:hypothetical protein